MLKTIPFYFLFTFISGIPLFAATLEQTPQIHLTNAGGCTLIDNRLKCWGKELLNQIKQTGALPKFDATTGELVPANLKRITGNPDYLWAIGNDNSIKLMNTSLVRMKFEGVPPFTEISIDDHFYGFNRDGMYFNDFSHAMPTIMASPKESFRLDGYGYSSCVLYGPEKKIRCSELGGDRTPRAFLDLTGIEEVKLGGNKTDPTACLIWGPERKLICHRLVNVEIEFPKLTQVHEIIRNQHHTFCAIYGPKREVECFSGVERGYAVRESGCEPKVKPYQMLIGKLPVENVIALSANQGWKYQQVCVLVEGRPVPLCWTFGCGDFDHLKLHGWTDEVFPDWHPRYGKGDYAQMVGAFTPGAPVVPIPPAVKPVDPAPAEPEVSKSKSAFEDL